MRNYQMLQLRETLGWTQEDLAKAVGVSRQTINGIEKGTQKPSFSFADILLPDQLHQQVLIQ